MKVKNVVIVGTLLLVLVIVSLKSFGYGFKSDAQKRAETSMGQENLITESDFGTLQGEIMVIDLGGGEQIHPSGFENLKKLTIPAPDILEKQNFRKLKKFKGNIILVADDPAVSARIWMLLSQMGIKNLYIKT